MKAFDNEDRELLVQLYMLSKEELKEAEKMFIRSSGMSECACGKVVAQRRKQGNLGEDYEK